MEEFQVRLYCSYFPENQDITMTRRRKQSCCQHKLIYINPYSSFYLYEGLFHSRKCNLGAYEQIFFLDKAFTQTCTEIIPEVLFKMCKQGVSKVAKQLNSLVVKPGRLSSIPGAYMVERANNSMLYKLSSDFLVHAMTHDTLLFTQYRSRCKQPNIMKIFLCNEKNVQIIFNV